MEYRGVVNFLFVAKIFGMGSGYIIIYLMFHSFKDINGWNVYEIIFLQAIFNIVYSLSSCLFFNSVEQFPQKIASGEFDAILTKPVNSLFYFMFRIFSTGYISNFLIAVSMLIFAWVNIGIILSISKIGLLILFIFGGVLIQSAIYIIAAVPNFWFIKGDAFTGLVLFGSANFVNYPLSIYKLPVQIVLSLIIPYGFVNFYPSQYFLAKNDYLFFPPVVQFLSPVIGIIFFLGAWKLWDFAVDHYQSTGS